MCLKKEEIAPICVDHAEMVSESAFFNIYKYLKRNFYFFLIGS